MTPEARKLTVQNLSVIDFKSEHITAELRDWSNAKHVLVGESCARQVFYGFTEDLADFPDPTERIARRRHQSEAYEFLLELACGFRSSRFGETHIKSQLLNRWKKWARTASPSWSKQYESFIGGLKKDSGFIRTKIMDGFASTSLEVVARDLSGQKPEDKVTLIADINLHGTISGKATKLLRACQNRQKGSEQFISITNPNPEHLEQIQDSAERMIQNNKLGQNICFSSFSEAGQIIAQSDQVYVTIPQSAEPDDEIKIRQAWIDHAKKGAVLVHLSGVPEMAMEIDELWKNAALENFIGPDKVHATQKKRQNNNGLISKNTRQAFKLIAGIRSEERQVFESELREKAPGMFSHCTVNAQP